MREPPVQCLCPFFILPILEAWAKTLRLIPLGFLENLRHQNLILRLSDLYLNLVLLESFLKRKKKIIKKHLLQIVLCQFIVLWMPMFLSSLTLSISNPGFTFGCEPNNDMQCIASVGLTLMDLSIFYLHPIILRWRISVLTKEQEGIDKSRNLALSQKYEKNAEILDLLNEQFFAFKKLELNLGGLHLLYLASVDS